MTVISKDRQELCFTLQKHYSPALLHLPEARPRSLPSVYLTLAGAASAQPLRKTFQHRLPRVQDYP